GKGRVRRGLQHITDEIRGVEIGPVQEIENLRAELQVHSLTYMSSLGCGEIPGRQTWTSVGIPPHIAVETAVARWRNKGVGIEPLVRISKNHGARKRGIEEWPHRIARVAVVRWVIAELWRKRESRLHANDGVQRPTANEAVSNAVPAAQKPLPVPYRQRITDVNG